MFVAWIFYGLGQRAFSLTAESTNLPRPIGSGIPWTPLVFTLAAAALVLNVIFYPTICRCGAGEIVVWRACVFLVAGEKAEPSAGKSRANLVIFDERRRQRRAEAVGSRSVGSGWTPQNLFGPVVQHGWRVIGSNILFVRPL